jgi:hypothetical protein
VSTTQPNPHHSHRLHSVVAFGEGADAAGADTASKQQQVVLLAVQHATALVVHGVSKGLLTVAALEAVEMERLSKGGYGVIVHQWLIAPETSCRH